MGRPTANVGQTVIFENSRIRVWDMRLQPGESSDLHHHSHDYVFIYVTPSDLELRLPDGRTTRRSYRDGFTQHTPVGPEGLTHQLTNVGAAPHRQIIVELLGPSEAGDPGAPETNERWDEPER